MNKSILSVLLFSTLWITGCASDYGKYAEMQTNIQVAKSNADAEKYKAISAIGSSGDVTAKVASLFALASIQATPQSTHLAAPKSAGDSVREWAAILIPSLMSGYGIYANQEILTTQSNNNKDIAISTNNAFVGMASQIQAPAANMTIGGDGVIGNGSLSSIVESYNPSPIDNSNQYNPIDNTTTSTVPVSP